MGFTLTFLHIFFLALRAGFPLLLFLVVSIICMGLVVGHIEKWKSTEAIYWSFITATTVGYGDPRPTGRISRLLAILIAIVGLILFGIIVSISVQATTMAAQLHLDLSSIQSISN